jgi:hypothetical protein
MGCTKAHLTDTVIFCATALVKIQFGLLNSICPDIEHPKLDDPYLLSLDHGSLTFRNNSLFSVDTDHHRTTVEYNLLSVIPMTMVYPCARRCFYSRENQTRCMIENRLCSAIGPQREVPIGKTLPTSFYTVKVSILVLRFVAQMILCEINQAEFWLRLFSESNVALIVIAHNLPRRSTQRSYTEPIMMLELIFKYRMSR